MSLAGGAAAALAFAAEEAAQASAPEVVPKAAPVVLKLVAANDNAIAATVGRRLFSFAGLFGIAISVLSLKSDSGHDPDSVATPQKAAPPIGEDATVARGAEATDNLGLERGGVEWVWPWDWVDGEWRQLTGAELFNRRQLASQPALLLCPLTP